MQAVLCNKQFKELGSEMKESNALHAELENMLGSFTRAYSAPSTAEMLEAVKAATRLDTDAHTDSVSDPLLTRSTSVDSRPTSADPRAAQSKGVVGGGSSFGRGGALEMMGQAAPTLSAPAAFPQLTHLQYARGAAASHDSHKCSGSSVAGVAGVATAAPSAVARLLAQGLSKAGMARPSKAAERETMDSEMQMEMERLKARAFRRAVSETRSTRELQHSTSAAKTGLGRQLNVQHQLR